MSLLNENILSMPSKLDNMSTKFYPISDESNPKREIAYYHREYENDLPSDKNTFKRIFLTALPLISLYKPFGFAISLGMDSLRTLTNLNELGKNLENKESTKALYSLFSTAISVTSIAATILYTPIGMLLISSHDTIQSSIYLIESIKDKNLEQIIGNTIKVANNALYGVSIFFGFSLELQVASLSLQVIYQIFNSSVDFKNGNYIELIGDISMALIRGNQLYSQSILLKKKWDIEKQIKDIFVGFMHDKWQFPSDHLPVGVEVDGVEIISWNVLNDQYLDWVYNDSQGLNGSMITDLDQPIKDGFTKRDQLVVDMINQMINQNDKRGVVALQECSSTFLEELKQSLPANWSIISDTDREDHNVVLYNTEKLSYNEQKSEISTDGYASELGRSILDLCFDRDGKDPIRIFNSHVPGDPNIPGRYEYAEYIKEHYDPEKEIAVALGDMNFERDEMIDALRKADLFDFQVHSPYQTNVDPYSKKSKCIDHLMVFGEDVNSTQIDRSEIGPDLDSILNQLSEENISNN